MKIGIDVALLLRDYYAGSKAYLAEATTHIPRLSPAYEVRIQFTRHRMAAPIETVYPAILADRVADRWPQGEVSER
jgi:hypothetical protein